MKSRYEIHFQEGFDHDRVEILLNGKPVEQIELVTRLQTGLAAIVAVEAGPRSTVTIRTGDDVETVSRLSKTRPFLRVNKIDNRIAIETADVSPGYV